MFLTEMAHRRKRLRYLLRLVRLEAERQDTERREASLRPRHCAKRPKSKSLTAGSS